MALFSKRDLVHKFSEGEEIGRVTNYVNFFKAQDTTKEYDIFLSHSYLNASEIYELKKAIEKFGFSVYVDWIEDASTLSRKSVTKETARILRDRMHQCKTLIYAHTTESISSKWMPWELGYFDAHKEKVSILPIEERASGTDTYRGQEYLGLYPYITKQGDINGRQRLWVNDETPDKYVMYEQWIIGFKPTKR